MKFGFANPLLLVSLLWFALPATGVRAEFARDYQQWAVLNIDLVDPLFEGLRFTLNTESRALNAPRRDARAGVLEEQNPNTLIMLRPIVGYQLTSWFTGWLGYAYQPILYSSEVREDIHEHRVFEQLSGSFRAPRLDLSYRTRLEQRYRARGDNDEVKQGEGRWAHRFRQQVRLAYTPVQTAPWQLIVYDELFVHLTDTPYPSRGGIDQNRIFGGVGFQAHPSFRFEAGYMNQLVRRFTDRHQLNHVLWISANLRFTFRQKAEPLATPAPALGQDSGFDETVR